MRVPSPTMLMSTAAWITMIVIMGFVWGGFALLLATALRKESARAPDDGVS